MCFFYDQVSILENLGVLIIKNERLKKKIIKIHLYEGTKKDGNITEARQNNEKN